METKHASGMSNGLILPTKEFADGAVSLWKGDVLRTLPHVPARAVDSVIVDSPYCSGGTTLSQKQAPPDAKYCQDNKTLGRPTFEGDAKDQRSFTAWCTQWMSECRDLTKPGGYLLAFIDWRNLPAMTDAVQMAGWHWKGIISWDKGRGVERPTRAISATNANSWYGPAMGNSFATPIVAHSTGRSASPSNSPTSFT